MRTHMLTDRRWLCVLAVIACLVIGALAFAQTPPSHPKNTKQPSQPQQLTPEQKLAEQQARYYQLQADKLLREPKTSWAKIADSPSAFVTALGAVLAALFTLMSFVFNYRAARRTEKDTQFYEALKRFGDSSPAVRSSAAGLIALMGRDHTPYYQTSLDELISALILERNLAVYDSMITAVRLMLGVDPRQAIVRLHKANILLQRQMKHNLARLFGFMGIEEPAQITDEQWDMAAKISQYRSEVLQELVARPLWQESFASNLSSSHGSWERWKGQRAEEAQDDAQEQLGLVSSKLRDTAMLMSECLGYRVLPDLDLSDAFLAQGNLNNAILRRANLRAAQLQLSHLNDAQLQETDLTECLLQNITGIGVQMQSATLFGAQLGGATLAGASFERADLRNANLSHASLINANLHDARLYGIIANTGVFGQTNWWQADMASDNPMVKDQSLLEDLYRKYRDFVPRDLDQIHQSAHDFIVQKQTVEQTMQRATECGPPENPRADGDATG